MSWLLPLARAATVLAWARAGGGHAFSGGGGFHGGGSYGGGFSGGSGNGGALFDLIYLYLRFVIAYPVMGVPLTIGLGYIAYITYLAQDDNRAYRTIREGLDVQDDIDLSRNIAALKERDPAFDPMKFLERVKTAFLTVQKGWSAQKLGEARLFVSDGVMERFSIQIAMQQAEGLRNDMSQVSVDESEIVQIQSDPFFDAISVRIAASALDRDLSLKDGQVLRGGGEPSSFEEVWTFLRRPSAKTLAGRSALEGYCPNCGAPLRLEDAGQCGACKSWINSGEYDWVLVEITQKSEWGPREPGRDVPGYAALAAQDPALNVRFLEDRVSAAFWRWQEAQWRGDAAGLAGIATDQARARIASQLSADFYEDAAAGAVIALALEPGEPFDRAHVIVRWSGKRIERAGGRFTARGQAYLEHVFVLGRKRGVKTDERSGLQSLRCPNCGAPPESREQAACSYCSTPFNDGSFHWVLLDVVPASSWRMPPMLPETGAAPHPSAAAPRTAFDYGWAGLFTTESAMRVMAATMAADAEIPADEQRYLVEFGRRRGVPESQVASYIAAAHARQVSIPDSLPPAAARACFQGILATSLAHGKLEDGERRLLYSFGQRLGLTGRQVDGMIEARKDELLGQAKEALRSAA